MEIILENIHGGGRYDRDRQVLQYRFVGLVNPELVKEICNAGLEFSKNNRIRGSYVDLSELSGTFTALHEYLTNHYFPAMIAQGLRCHAIILPHDIFTQFAANSLIQRMGDFTMQTFGNVDEAVAWTYQHAGTALKQA